MSLQRAMAVFTPEEYLDLERQSEIRHEFLDGTVYAMSGESPASPARTFMFGDKPLQFVPLS